MMDGEATARYRGDSAAGALALILQLLGVPANPSELLHASGKEELDEFDLLRAAKRFPVKTKLSNATLEQLKSAPLPALVRLKIGGWLVVGQVNDQKVLVQNPLAVSPEVLDIDDFAARWDGVLVLMVRRAALTDPHFRFDLGWFWDAIKKYRKPLGEVLLGSFFVQLCALLSPLFFQVIIDKVFVQRGLSTLEVLALGLGIVSIFEVVLGGIRTYVLSHTSNRIDVELGSRLFHHLFALPLAYFHVRRVGDTIARVRELENIRQFLTSSALTLALDLFFSLIFIAVLLLYSVKLTVIVALSLPCYVLLSVGVTPVFRRRLQERFRRGSENQSFLVEAVSGVETLKSMALEPTMQRRWEEQLAAYVKATFEVTTLGTVASQCAAFINKLTTILVLFFGAKLVIDNRLTVGELVAFNMIASQLASPVLRIAQLWQDFQQVRLSIDRVGDILNTKPEASPNGQANLPAIRGAIDIERLQFRYRLDGPPILRDVSLSVPAGQILGIVGPSGSGKSTLGKLIQRLYLPESGRVMIDGIDLSLADPAWLRRQVGVVLQESVLFNRTVRENIALANPAVAIERVVEAAGLAGAHEFILGLPEAYDTVIGERGASLSGGQRQRIAIARALMANPRILIFDEATSALDYESEAAIQDNMQRICTGRTVLLIAHRLSTLRIADRIITIDKGQIVEDGPHDTLLKSGGRYAKLWQLQSGQPAAAAMRASQ
jgi:subfamily B ATP-binding cassette protein HlyB/CyaB